MLAGWYLDFPTARTILPGLASMKANTAACFVVSGIALLCLGRWGRPGLRRTGHALGGLVGLVALLTLSQDIGGWDLGIDAWLFDFRRVAGETGGRMSPATALAFVFCGISLAAGSRWLRARLFHYGAIAAGFLALLGCFGYLFDVRALYQLGPYRSVALHTALGFLLLASGIVASGPLRGSWAGFQRLAAGVGVAALVSVGWIVYERLDNLAAADRWEDHTRQVLLELEWLFSAVIDAESAQRAYLASADGRDLERYRRSLAAVAGRLASVRQLTDDNISQQKRLQELDEPIRGQLDAMERALRLARGSGFEAALAIIRDRTAMARVRRGLAEVEGEERRLLAMRSAAKEADIRNATRTLVVGGASGTLILLGISLLLWREVSRRQASESALQAHRDRLETLVEQRTRHLAIANEDLQTEMTLRMETLASLRRSEAQLRLFIDHAPAALAMFDRSMRYVAVSQRWRADYGLSSRSLIGQCHYDIFPVLPEAWKEIHRRALAGEVLRAEADRFEWSDGRVQRLNWEVRPWRAADGAIGGIVIFSEDITERWETRLALGESEARCAAIFEQAAVGISRVGLDGCWLQVNDELCAILGYRRDELTCRRMQDIAHADDIEAERELARQLLAGEIHNYSQEMRFVRGNGPAVWVKLSVALVRTAQGLPDYFVAVVQDIQHRKEAEATLAATQEFHRQRLEQLVAERTAALREARDHLEDRVVERTEQVRRLAAELTYAEERERQALARDLHDDLGQLLHVINIKLGLLGRLDLPAAGRSLLEEGTLLVGDASRKIRSLTSQLNPPVLATLGLPAALRWLCGEMGQNYGLTVSCRAEMPAVRLSPLVSAILFRAARELLINVAKHAGTDAAALVLEGGEASLAMRIEDGGIGIAALDEAIAGARGFGLASVRERIGFLGGTMSIETSPGEGVRIVIWVPLDSEMKMTGNRDEHTNRLG